MDESAEAGAPESGLGDFSDIKKKKKSKKAAFDLEAFEKELEDSTSKPTAEEDDGGLDDIDDEDLGDDPFAVASGQGIEGGGEVEAWHGSDRDYTYAEVGRKTKKSIIRAASNNNALHDSSAPKSNRQNSPFPKP